MSFHVSEAELLEAPCAASVMHTNLPLVPHDLPMQQAVQEMARFGCVGVMDDMAHLMGIITDGDIRRGLRRHDDFMGQRAKNVMTFKPITIAPHTTVNEALAIMNHHRITALFVVESGKAVGIVHIHDLLQ